MPSDLERNIIKSELSTKLSNWSVSAIQSYYGDDILTHIGQPALINPAAFEKYSNGYIVARPNNIEYVDITNGNIFKLKETPNLLDWTCFNDLKTRLDADAGSARIETGSHREVLSSGREYTELSPPGGSFGETAVTKLLEDPTMDTSVTMVPFLSQMITDIASILPHAKAVAEANSAGITTAFFRVDNYWVDADGGFFSNCDTGWILPPSEAVEAGLLYLAAILDDGLGGKISASDSADLMTQARDSWL